MAGPGREPAADVARGAEQGLVIGRATFNIPHVEHLHVEHLHLHQSTPEPGAAARLWLPEA